MSGDPARGLDSAHETAAAPPQEVRPASAGARFTPGTLLASRYRIVSPLGKGGMGEVYRADDVRLGQPVALKFLPAAFASDVVGLERLVDEVRIGRQISHPNVCRLYDISEAEGHHFLVMEYVDGEDLASLLRRIGRLPGDKALEIARGVCAGLAAAHDKGVIHRDLKPANVMIDGHGHARIADFGLAALAASGPAAGLAGTPAYMAPEQLRGDGASLRSDVYSLGLLLYEMFTGRRVFEAKSLDELRALHAAATPLSLTSSAKDVAPEVERVVLRCLERDPKDRPASARIVLASLPGGDPLQAAVLAGETPSPEMVAAAAKVGDLQPAVAWACLLAGLLGLVLVAFLAGTTTLIGRVRPAKAPAVLTEKARELLASVGYADPPVDVVSSFDLDFDCLEYLARPDASPSRWGVVGALRPGPLLFWYRQSGEAIAARSFPLLGQVEIGRITREDPPPIDPGMVEVVLDRQGSLLSLRAVPPRFAPAGPGREPDWSVLLAAAGLEASALQPVAPSWTAPVDSDRKAAWDGAYPGQPGVAVHVEAAAFRGKPVWFEVHGPWVRPEPPRDGAMVSVISWTAVGLVVVLLAAIGAVVRRNLRLGRSDRRGGARLAGLVSASLTLGLMFRADHVASVRAEAGLVMNLLALVLFNAAAIWGYYIAIEPIARRNWPHLLISWSRLLAGRLRDPLVGRDGLIGAVAGVGLALVIHLAIAGPTWLGLAPQPLRARVVTTLASSRHFVYFVAYGLCGAVGVALGVLFLSFLLRSVLRSRRLALAFLFAVLYVVFLAPPITGSSTLWSTATFLFTAIWLSLLVRVGLLAGMVSLFVFLVLDATPLTLHLSDWYAGPTRACLALVGGLLVCCFGVALAGRPVFGHPLMEGEGRP